MIYMEVIKNLLKPKNRREVYFLIALVLYILTKIQTPEPLAKLVDNAFGVAVVIALSLALFTKTNPVVGVMLMIAAYELIKRSSEATGTHAIRNQLPSENKKLSDFSKYNDFPVTLEEELVAKMAPLVKHPPAANADYKPIISDLHEASTI